MEQIDMAFTGKKIKGSEILTDQTLENRKVFCGLLNDIKENNPEEYSSLVQEMFHSMFEHLSHTHEEKFIEWAKNVEHRTFFKKASKGRN